MAESRLIEIKLVGDHGPVRDQLFRYERALPGWIDADPPAFAFPYWSPRWRPFDWAEDFGGWRVTGLEARPITADCIVASKIAANAITYPVEP